MTAMRGPSHLVSGFLDGSLPLPGQDEVDARLTELDRQLVRLLQADGRRSFAGMARDLGVPEKTVRRKVNQLLDDNVIQITAVADPALLGFPVMALVGLAFDGGQAVKPLMNSSRSCPPSTTPSSPRAVTTRWWRCCAVTRRNC